MSLPQVTDIEFAELGATSEGNGSWKVPTLDSYGTSDSAMLAGDWSSLEWDTYPPAGKDEKPSWGFGGKAPDGRAVGAVISSLDLYTNNRHKQKPGLPLGEVFRDYLTENQSGLPDYQRRPVGRGKFCGRKCVRGLDPKTGQMNYRRINCGSWTCCYCGPRRANMARRAIQKVAEDLGLRYFLTLTLDPKKIEHRKFYVPMLRLTFNKFREYLRRKFGTSPSYVCVLEFTQNGVPHLHILFDRYIEQSWISDVWDTLGGGRICFIKRVTVQKVARYLSKYLTKELILSAPKGTRRITAARSIKLFPKFNSGIAWELLGVSIWRKLEEHRMSMWEIHPSLLESIAIEMDEERYLKAFQIHNALTDEGGESTYVQ